MTNELNNLSAGKYFLNGVAKHKTHDYIGAIQDYTKAIEINPEFIEAFSNRGIAHKQLKNYRGAIEDFTKCIQIKPNIASLYSNRGAVKNELHDFIGAMADYVIAKNLDPTDTSVFCNVGVIYFQQKEYHKAIQEYDVAIQLDSENAIAFMNRGVAKKELHDYNGALNDLSNAIMINPNYANAYVNIGLIKTEQLKDPLGAIEYFSKAIEINPNLDEAYYNRGIAKDNLQDYKGANDDYTRALHINPNNSEAYCNRGVIKKEQQDYEGAIDDYNNAIICNSKNAAAYYNRGMAFIYLGKKENGYADLKKSGEFGFERANDVLKENEALSNFSSIISNKSQDLLQDSINSDNNSSSFKLSKKLFVDKSSHSNIDTFTQEEYLNDSTVVSSVSNGLTDNEKSSIVKLTVVGTIDARDFRCIRSQMPKLEELDISAVKVIEYRGEGGTKLIDDEPGDWYPENEIPFRAFYYDHYNFNPAPYERGALNDDWEYIEPVLSTIILPEFPHSYHPDAFTGCKSLRNLTLGQGKCNFFSDENININVLDCEGPLHLTIPRFFVFSRFNLHNLKNLSSLTIECAEIGQASFLNCESLS